MDERIRRRRSALPQLPASLPQPQASDLAADVEVGVMSAVLVHIANISYRLKRSLVFDPKTSHFRASPRRTGCSLVRRGLLRGAGKSVTAWGGSSCSALAPRSRGARGSTPHVRS